MRRQPATCAFVLVLAASVAGCLSSEDGTMAVDLPTEALAKAPNVVPIRDAPASPS